MPLEKHLFISAGTLIMLASLPFPVGADQIKLKNGDVLTGDIIKKENTTVIFKTSYAGNLTIQWSEIENITSDTPVQLVLEDGSRVNGELISSDPGAVGVRLTKNGRIQTVDLARTRYINPSPELIGKGFKWTGHINAGGTITQGNNETKGITFDAESIIRWRKDRFTIGGAFNRAEDRGRDTQFNSRAYGKYDRFLDPKWYIYANTTFENDRFRDLRLRSTYGGGSGYQIFEQPDLNLSIEGGLNYVREDFYHDHDDSYPGVRWALKYDQLLLGSTKLFHEHELLVDVQKTNHMLFHSKTGLRFPPIFNFNATTQLNYDWDSDPPPGRERMDSMLLFTLGYGW